MRDDATIPCMYCLFLRDWTWADAFTRTMVKNVQSNGLFLELVTSRTEENRVLASRPCHACVPKRGGPTKPWKGLKEYYKRRGLRV